MALHTIESCVLVLLLNTCILKLSLCVKSEWISYDRSTHVPPLAPKDSFALRLLSSPGTGTSASKTTQRYRSAKCRLAVNQDRGRQPEKERCWRIFWKDGRFNGQSSRQGKHARTNRGMFDSIRLGSLNTLHQPNIRRRAVLTQYTTKSRLDWSTRALSLRCWNDVVLYPANQFFARV